VSALAVSTFAVQQKHIGAHAYLTAGNHTGQVITQLFDGIDDLVWVDLMKARPASYRSNAREPAQV
jgi:hypothetical protein